MPNLLSPDPWRRIMPFTCTLRYISCSTFLYAIVIAGCTLFSHSKTFSNSNTDSFNSLHQTSFANVTVGFRTSFSNSTCNTTIKICPGLDNVTDESQNSSSTSFANVTKVCEFSTSCSTSYPVPTTFPKLHNASEESENSSSTSSAKIKSYGVANEIRITAVATLLYIIIVCDFVQSRKEVDSTFSRALTMSAEMTSEHSNEVKAAKSKFQEIFPMFIHEIVLGKQMRRSSTLNMDSIQANNLTRTNRLIINYIRESSFHQKIVLKTVPQQSSNTNYRMLVRDGMTNKQTLEALMLQNLMEQEACYPFIEDVVLLIYNLLEAVNELHRNGVYHLNLEPYTVNYIKKEDKQRYFIRKKDPELIVFLPNLEHAVRSGNGIVESSNVGLTDFYRPPESFWRENLSASKVDSWSIGIIAFELLTGGMLNITLNKDYPYSAGRCMTILRRVLNLGYLSTAMDINHKVISRFNYMRYRSRRFKGYNMDETEFFRNCFEFVNGLLEENPNDRWSINEALNSKLMQRVQKHGREIRKHPRYIINYLF